MEIPVIFFNLLGAGLGQSKEVCPHRKIPDL